MEDSNRVTRLYSLESAARQLGISIWTLRSHQKRGSLRVTRVGRRVMVSQPELDRIAASGLPSLAAHKSGDVIP